MFSLPVELQSIIQQFAGVDDDRKLRFTNDVLSCIDKGNRIVGNYYGVPCPLCYNEIEIVGSDGCVACGFNSTIGQVETMVVTYDEYVASIPFFVPYKTYEDHCKWTKRGPMTLEKLDKAIWAWMCKNKK